MDTAHYLGVFYVAARTTAAASAREAHGWFRGDITGLRTLAIVPVVAFHAGIPGLNGGFIGVDIFYVISGFLITTNLLREANDTGRIGLLNFWGKRIRRLAPAATLMVLVTLLLTLVLISPLRWRAIGEQAGAAVLNISNFLFASQSTDYFAADLAAPSPLLHTWSLGVEEQFYLVWPVLIAIAVAIAVRRRLHIKTILAVLFSVIVVGSFLLSLFWTTAEPQWAFYLLPARAWEFAAAGLLALVAAKGFGSAAVRAGMTWAGIVVLVGGVLFLPQDVPFPGTAALVPVIGTLLVLVGGIRIPGTEKSSGVRLLEARPMQWIGNVSYSWYLWHWPFIILATYALQSESVWLKTAASILSLGVGALTYYYVENPIRFSRKLQSSIVKTFAFLVVGIVLVGGAGIVTSQAGTAVARPYAKTLIGAKHGPSAQCTVEKAPGGQALCVLGDRDSTETVVLVGDSHANQWRVTLGAAAAEQGIRLVVRAQNACSAIAITTADTNGNVSSSCPTFQKGTLAVIRDVKPRAVILAQAEGYLGRILGPDKSHLSEAEQLTLWTTQHDAWLAEVSKYTDRVGTFRDNPRLHFDPNDCLTKLGGSPDRCAPPRDDALDMVGQLQALSAVSDKKFGVDATFGTIDTLCDDTSCKVSDNGVPVYRDYNHLSRAWTYTQLPELSSFLKTLVT